MDETSTAKIALLAYCRYKKQMPYIATEVGTLAGCLADVLASDGKSLVEFEVKVSLQDLLRDSKKPKHKYYNEAQGYSQRGSPNMLYYAIPEWLWEKHQERILASVNEKYGIITFVNIEFGNMQVVKRATKLHDHHVTQRALMVLVKRMASELVGLSVQINSMYNNMFTIGQRIEDSVRLEDGIEMFTGSLDTDTTTTPTITMPTITDVE